MIYLTKEYLNTFIFEKFLDESSQDYFATLDNLEAANIDLIKTYIGGLYDTDAVFSEASPVLNELMKKILAKLIVYDAVRRNAARKVPTDYKQEFDWAIAQLEKINSGRLELNLPPAKDNNGNAVQSDSMFGNLSNPDFYI